MTQDDVIRIAVVEDDPTLGALLEEVLRDEGFAVTIVPDGKDALDVLSSWRFDAVVLDLMLPRVDGYEILRTLRADRRTRSLPVMIVSARADQSSKWEGWQAGCDWYLTKPFAPHELVAGLRRLVAA